MKSLVPGLSRGVQVWRVLCDQGEASLEQVTQRTGFPKASVLRMLQTLCALQLVDRSEQTGLYRATARIVYSSGPAPELEARVRRTLEQLSATLHVTAEWFEPGEEGLLLSMRESPAEAEVTVKARSGFMRKWNDELEAVASLGYAFWPAAPKTRSSLWIYDPRGRRVKLTPAESKARIDKARATGTAVDTCYNSNGVKRIAAAVVRNGNLVGVLALACAFTPSLGLELDEKEKAVCLAADELRLF